MRPAVMSPLAGDPLRLGHISANTPPVPCWVTGGKAPEARMPARATSNVRMMLSPPPDVPARLQVEYSGNSVPAAIFSGDVACAFPGALLEGSAIAIPGSGKLDIAMTSSADGTHRGVTPADSAAGTRLKDDGPSSAGEGGEDGAPPPNILRWRHGGGEDGLVHQALGPQIEEEESWQPCNS